MKVSNINVTVFLVTKVFIKVEKLSLKKKLLPLQKLYAVNVLLKHQDHFDLIHTAHLYFTLQ